MRKCFNTKLNTYKYLALGLFLLFSMALSAPLPYSAGVPSRNNPLLEEAPSNLESLVTPKPVFSKSQETKWEDRKYEEKNLYPDVTIETVKEKIAPEPTPEDIIKAMVEKKEESKSTQVENGKPLYRLRIGDQLLISLYGFREARTERSVTVDMTGSISYLFVNTVFALGKTIDELRKELQELVLKQYPNVMVSVSALSLIGDNYTIMGEVNLPGTKNISGDVTVLNAIAQAGGFPMRNFRGQLIDYIDLDRSFLARHGEYIPLDFKKLIKEGDLSQDQKLENGDYLYIPSMMTKEIYVLGEVNRPSVYNYIHTATLMEVIANSRGFTRNAAHRVMVIRGALNCPQTYVIDRTLIAKGCMPDFILCPGDVVYVPPPKFATLKELVRTAISTFVSTIAFEAGNRAFISIDPRAANNPNLINNNAVIVNPGTIIAPTPIIIQSP